MAAVDHVFSTALFHHRAGNLQQAEAYCQRALRKESGHAESLHLLGMIASQSGNQPLAASLIGRAIKSAGPRPEYCVDLGMIMSREGRFDAAATCYRQALQADPGNWKTLLKLGLTLSSLGYQRDAHEVIQTAITIGGNAEAYFELANQLHNAGDLDQAVEHFRAAIRLRPTFPEAYFNLGVSLMKQRRTDDAMEAYSNALRLKPRYPEALNNYGILLQLLGRLGEASSYYIRAIEHNQDYPDPRYNLALVRQDQDRHDEALEGYNALLSLNPNHSEAHNNRGNALLALGRPFEAVAAYSEAIQRQPEHAEANWNLSLANLLLGHFTEGWQGYDWRLRQNTAKPQSFPVPLWNGAATPTARILVHAEQGFGDTLQFVRYAAMVKERCGFLIVQCQLPLVRTLYSVAGIDQVVARGTNLPPFDCHIPLLSLPGIFKTVEETIPSPMPYIAPPASLQAKWRERIPVSADLTVGLVWAGNPGHKNDRNRSIPPELFSTLLSVPGIRFFSLQKDLELAGAIPLGLEFTDFADTAAAIANLDLIISVDTSVAHLAGAMNIPVWTLLPFNPDWRWMLNRTDTPWYPSMRLFRQAESKNWQPVMEQVKTELLAHHSNRNPALSSPPTSIQSDSLPAVALVG